MGKRYSIKELTCPECGWVAKNANGLRGHRQFKHGVLPISSKGLQRVEGRVLPDELATESSLRRRLRERDERLGFAKPDAQERLLSSAASAPITDSVRRISSKLATLKQQQSIAASSAELRKLAAELKADVARIRDSISCVFVAIGGTNEELKRQAIKEIKDKVVHAKLVAYIKNKEIQGEQVAYLEEQEGRKR